MKKQHRSLTLNPISARKVVRCHGALLIFFPVCILDFFYTGFQPCHGTLLLSSSVTTCYFINSSHLMEMRFICMSFFVKCLKYLLFIMTENRPQRKMARMKCQKMLLSFVISVTDYRTTLLAKKRFLNHNFFFHHPPTCSEDVYLCCIVSERACGPCLQHLLQMWLWLSYTRGEFEPRHFIVPKHFPAAQTILIKQNKLRS